MTRRRDDAEKDWLDARAETEPTPKLSSAEWTAAEARVVEQLLPSLNSAARRFRSPSAAVDEEDLRQDVLLTILDRGRSGSTTVHSLQASIFSMLRGRYLNATRSERRRKSAYRQAGRVSTDLSPLESAVDAEQSQSLSEIIRKSLSGRELEALDAYLSGLTYREIGKKLGINSDAVRFRVHRLTLKMRRLLSIEKSPGTPESDSRRDRAR